MKRSPEQDRVELSVPGDLETEIMELIWRDLRARERRCVDIRYLEKHRIPEIKGSFYVITVMDEAYESGAGASRSRVGREQNWPMSDL